MVVQGLPDWGQLTDCRVNLVSPKERSRLTRVKEGTWWPQFCLESHAPQAWGGCGSHAAEAPGRKLRGPCPGSGEGSPGPGSPGKMDRALALASEGLPNLAVPLPALEPSTGFQPPPSLCSLSNI